MRVLAGHFMLLRRSRGSETDNQWKRSRKSIEVAFLFNREIKRTMGTENGSLDRDERAKINRFADVGRLEKEATDVRRNRFGLVDNKESD